MPIYGYDDPVQTIQNRYARIRNLLRRDGNQESLNRSSGSTISPGSPGTGMGLANQYWQNVPSGMSESAKRSMMNRAATRAMNQYKGTSDRIREAAAQGGWGNSAVVPSLITNAEFARNAATQSAMTDVDLHADDVARQYALSKAQGYGNFALGQEGLNLQKRSQDTALEQMYQNLMYQMGRDQVEGNWRERQYGDQQERQGIEDERYKDTVGYDRGIDEKEWQLFQEQKEYDDLLKEISLNRLKLKFPELFRKPNEKSPLGVAYR